MRTDNILFLYELKQSPLKVNFGRFCRICKEALNCSTFTQSNIFASKNLRMQSPPKVKLSHFSPTPQVK